MTDIKCENCNGSGYEIIGIDGDDEIICNVCYGVGTIAVYDEEKRGDEK